MPDSPLAIDLFCGLGGWSDGLLAEGYQVIGFDIERRPYPGQLVLQDALTIHGSQFRDAAVIVASPPCTEYSYMAMPWTRGKQIAGDLRASNGRGSRRDSECAFPDEYTGSRTISELNALFDACFRIQREASEAAGWHIPMVVENVKGAQPWVGPAKAHFGSFYLWGDIGSIGGAIVAGGVRFGNTMRAAKRGRKLPGNNGPRMWADREVKRLCDAPIKNNGGSWFAQAHNTESGLGNNPDGRKTQKAYAGSGSWKNSEGKDWRDPSNTGIKQAGHSGRAWFADPDVAGHFSSKSSARKEASAQIAKIPFELARHIARAFKPEVKCDA